MRKSPNDRIKRMTVTSPVKIKELCRSYLKIVFRPNRCAGAAFQLLHIRRHVPPQRNLKPGPALILVSLGLIEPKSVFKMASTYTSKNCAFCQYPSVNGILQPRSPFGWNRGASQYSSGLSLTGDGVLLRLLWQDSHNVVCRVAAACSLSKGLAGAHGLNRKRPFLDGNCLKSVQGQVLGDGTRVVKRLRRILPPELPA